MPKSRRQRFDQIRDDGNFDVIVVGGGINGIGAFRELALQGLRVLLVERNDFCSACSAAPSRMIHGGLRYLENGELKLVRESLRERDALLQNAPHQVHPLPTTIPITSTFSGLLNSAVSFLGFDNMPQRRGALPIKIGLSLYDWITRHRRLLPRHSFRSAKSTFQKWPRMSRRVRYSATYHDAWISHPERLGLELLIDAEMASPRSIALNYAEISPNGRGFKIRDKLSGEDLPVSTSALVNATGAWIDQATNELGRVKTNLVAGTKGSHIILDSPELFDALNGHMMYFENADGRVCIVYPYLGKVLAGATDIRVDHASRVRCEPEERDYILSSLGQVFPDIKLDMANVVFAYSGIRPLLQSDHDFTGRISRSHYVRLIDGPVPQFCMVGGKWTTFRAFAEQTADQLLAKLGRPRKIDTLTLPIGGGEGFPDDPQDLVAQLKGKRGLSKYRADHLVEVYGTRADEIATFCATQENDQPLEAGCDTTVAEVLFIIRHEMVSRISDVILRRTSLAITGKISTSLIRTIADVAARELGWSSTEITDEIAGFIDELQDYYGVSQTMLDARTQQRILS